MHEPGALDGVTIPIGDRTIELPVSIGPNRVVTIDALGRGTCWPGGMAEGRAFEVEGGPITLPPGSTPIKLPIDRSDGYAGDLSIRICRTWPLSE